MLKSSKKLKSISNCRNHLDNHRDYQDTVIAIKKAIIGLNILINNAFFFYIGKYNRFCCNNLQDFQLH